MPKQTTQSGTRPVEDKVTEAHPLSSVSFFPSVSTFLNVHERPVDLVRLLVALGHPRFLLSAYDVHHASADHQQAIRETLKQARQQGIFVLLDSGNYEGFWWNRGLGGNVPQDWTEEKFMAVLPDLEVDLAFAFDDSALVATIDSAEHAAELASEQYERLANAIGKDRSAPILHGDASFLPDAAAALAKKTGASVIAVPERELGVGIYDRCQCLKEVHQAVAKQQSNTVLHVLGTGHPYSIMAFAACGATSFDGLEWCKYAAIPSEAQLYPASFSQMFNPEPSSEAGPRIDGLQRSLSYYRDWEMMTDRARKDGELVNMLRAFCPGNFDQSPWSGAA